MSEQNATATTTATPTADGAAPAVVDVTPATPTHVQEASKVESFRDRMARAKARFEKPVEAKLEGLPEAPAKAESEPEASPVDVAPATDAKSEAAHARALAALRKAELENLRIKNEGKTAAEKLAADLASERAALQSLKAQIEEISKNPVAALKAAGMTADQFMRSVVDGKIKPPAPEDDLRDQVQSKLTPLEQELAAIKAELAATREKEEAAREEARVAEAREKDLSVVRQIVTPEEYPITAALGAFDVVLNACYQSGSQDVAAKAAEFEAHQIGLLEGLLTPKVLTALEKRSAKIRETVSAIRGAGHSRQAAGSGGGPRVAAARDVVSAPTTPVEAPKSDAERMARAKARLNGLAS